MEEEIKNAENQDINIESFAKTNKNMSGAKKIAAWTMVIIGAIGVISSGIVYYFFQYGNICEDMDIGCIRFYYGLIPVVSFIAFILFGFGLLINTNKRPRIINIITVISIAFITAGLFDVDSYQSIWFLIGVILSPWAVINILTCLLSRFKSEKFSLPLGALFISLSIFALFVDLVIGISNYGSLRYAMGEGVLLLSFFLIFAGIPLGLFSLYFNKNTDSAKRYIAFINTAIIITIYLSYIIYAYETFQIW